MGLLSLEFNSQQRTPTDLSNTSDKGEWRKRKETSCPLIRSVLKQETKGCCHHLFPIFYISDTVAAVPVA